MPSPGRQRGGGSKSGKSGQSGPRGKGSKRGSAGGKVSRSGRLGVGWLRTSGTEEDLGKTNKELRAERKTYTDKSGPVRKATKAEKKAVQKTLDNASKTAGETKPKRTGGGGTRFMPKIGGSPYKRTTVSQRLRRILE